MSYTETHPVEQVYECPDCAAHMSGDNIDTVLVERFYERHPATAPTKRSAGLSTAMTSTCVEDDDAR
jgi:hypothetical protein